MRFPEAPWTAARAPSWLLVLCCAAPGVAQKTPDVLLNTGANPAFADAPAIAASGSAVYVTWEDDRNGAADVYFNRSLDGGATWLGSDVRLDTDAPGAAASRQPQVAALGSDVYVLWWDERGGSAVYFNGSSDGGATWWPKDQRIDRGPGTVSSVPRIAVSGSSVYAVWQDDRTGSEGIYFNGSPDGGAPGTWLADDRRLDSGRNPQVAAAGAAVYVAWERAAAGIYTNRSLDGGATWLPSCVRIDTGPGPTDPLPQIAASGASVYVTWADDRSGHYDIWFNRSLDAGATWLRQDVRLNTDAEGLSISYLPAIAASESAVYVTWQDDRSCHAEPFYRSVRDIYFNRSLDRGTTWLADDVRLDTDPPGAAQSAHPRVAAAGSGVHVTWEDDRNGTGPGQATDIYWNRSLDRGTTWLGSDVRLDTDPAGTAASLFPVIAAEDTSVYVAWRDQRRSSLYPDIRFNIPFGFQGYGAGTAGAGGCVPDLLGTGYAALGETVAIAASNGTGGAVGAMLIGCGPAAKVSAPFLGGTLLVRPDFAHPFALGGIAGRPGAGSGALSFTIPPQPALVGVNLDFQALLLDAGAPRGVAMTRGVEMWIG